MNIVVAVPVDESYASFLGKKGSSNGITFYNRKVGNDVVVALFPSHEDDKVYALAQALLVSSHIVLSTDRIDKRFGEALIASSLLDRKIIFVGENEVRAMAKESGVSDYIKVSKEELLDAIMKNPAGSDDEKPVRVDIDKAFPVKGVGTVALGFVTRGVLKQHDKLYHSSGKEVLVRSIQSQDEDVVSAARGVRVGVALREIDEGEIGKGDLLTLSPVSRSERMVVEYRISNVLKEAPKESALYGIAIGFSYAECTVEKVGSSTLELKLRSKLPVEAGDEVLFIKRDIPRVFAAGRVVKAL